MERLRFRRQYLISPIQVSGLDQWKQFAFEDKSYFVYAHPDISTEFVKSDGKELLLLGYWFNADAPEKTDRENLLQLLHSKDFEALSQNIANFSGRFVLIYKDAGEFKIIHDTFGLREIYYTTQGGKIWAATQPNLLAKFLKLIKRSDPGFLEFINCGEFRTDREKFMIGDNTLYEDVKHLLPNHLLNIRTGTTERYWPTKHLDKIPYREAVEISANMLKGFLKAAYLRNQLIVPLTAGYDSRLILAATKEFKDELPYFIYNYPHLGYNNPDIYIPLKLSELLKFNFKVYEVLKPSEVDVKFKEVFEENYTLPNYIHAHYNFYNHFENKMNLLSMGSELGRQNASFINPYTPVNGQTLTTFHEWPYPPLTYPIEQTEIWLKEVNDILEEYQMNVLMLFFWEQMLGNWGAQGTTLADISIETYSVFNCRRLMEVMMSVDKKYKRNYEYKFYTDLIKKLWPEVLKQPINPPISLKEKIAYYTSRVGIYPLVKRFYKIKSKYT